MESLITWEVEGEVFRAGVVTKPCERDAVHRLRYHEYVEVEHQIPPEACPNGRETDWADDHSLHLIAFLGREAVGTARLIRCEDRCLLDGAVFSGTEFRFPEIHPVSGEPVRREDVVEFSRWVGRVRTLPSGTKVLVSNLMLEVALAATRDVLRRPYWVTALKAKNWPRLVEDGWSLLELIPGVHTYHDSRARVGWLDIMQDFPCRRTI